jgi:hypothetical protein
MRAPAWWLSLSPDERADLVGSLVVGVVCCLGVLLLIGSRW